jgi:co-chaperonin GroES (HSP10)
MFPDKTNSLASSRRDNHVPWAQEISGVMTPLGDWIYVEPDIKKEHKTESGLIIQGPKRQGVPNTGTIVYLGPDVPKELGLKKRMRVVVNDPNMRGFHLNKRPVVPLKPENILAIIEEDS